MSNPFENPFKNKGENKSEKKENKGEKISEERGSLFSRVFQRILEERKAAGDEVSGMSGNTKNVYELIKRIPVVRGIATANEGVMGGEPGKKLSTKESLVKYGTGVLMMAADVIKMQEKRDTGEKPEHVFKGKTLDWLEKVAQNQAEKKLEGETGAMQTILNFLKENRDIVENFEAEFEKVAEGSK